MSENEPNVMEFPTQKQVELENQTYRLEEMSDAMKKSIDNAKKICEEQQLLIDVVRASEHSEKFDDFVKNVETQIEDINSQIETLTVRSSLLDQVVIICKESDEAAKMTSMLLKALGVFENN